MTLDIKKGDEIITTPISFVATSNMFITLGAKPIWCDVKKDGNINEELIENLITNKTKAVVVVDFAGKPVEFEKITKIAKKHNLILIDDASHAFGSSIENKKVGSFCDASIFSFHAIKPITTGEGGMVVTNDEKLYNHLKLIRSHGITKKELWYFDMQEMGYNFRLTDIAAALGVSQLKKIDNFIRIRNEIASYYDKRFKGHKFFSTQNIDKNQISSRHLYPVLLSKKLHDKKELVFKELLKNSIGTQVHYKPIYQNSYYKQKFGYVDLKEANNFYNSEISLPCHHAMKINDAKFIADTFLKIIDDITNGV